MFHEGGNLAYRGGCHIGWVNGIGMGGFTTHCPFSWATYQNTYQFLQYPKLPHHTSSHLTWPHPCIKLQNIWFFSANRWIYIRSATKCSLPPYYLLPSNSFHGKSGKWSPRTPCSTNWQCINNELMQCQFLLHRVFGAHFPDFPWNELDDSKK